MYTSKIVFMGSPEFAIPSLKGLIKQFNVVGVVTQPDKPAGRGKVLKAPPIKEIAQSNNVEFIQPKKLRDPKVFEKLKSWAPDLIVVAAFGQILHQEVLDLPRLGCINVHASLLPRWRGAAPIQAAILHGDEITGITIMKMDAGIDTGPILNQKFIRIKPDDTSESLRKSLSYLGADLLLETIPDYFSGSVKAHPQPDTEVTYASLLKKDDGLLDFSKKAYELDRQIRAFYPWPGTFMEIGGERLKVLSAKIVDKAGLEPGERGQLCGYPMVGTAQGALVLEKVQPAGKKAMDGKIFLNGFRLW